MLREKYPSFFDENGNLKQNAAELVDMLMGDYVNTNDMMDNKTSEKIM